MRAESFYNLATNIDDLDSEPSSWPRIIDSYGGKSLHEQSHGKSFFALFQNRFSGKGIYILDESEAALSPSGQMSITGSKGDKGNIVFSVHWMSYCDVPVVFDYYIQKASHFLRLSAFSAGQFFCPSRILRLHPVQSKML